MFPSFLNQTPLLRAKHNIPYKKYLLWAAGNLAEVGCRIDKFPPYSCVTINFKSKNGNNISHEFFKQELIGNPVRIRNESVTVIVSFARYAIGCDTEKARKALILSQETCSCLWLSCCGNQHTDKREGCLPANKCEAKATERLLF